MRNYEVMYILDPGLPDEEINALKERFTELAKSRGAEIEKVSPGEKRRLAYSIRGHREGVYVLMELRAQPEATQELGRQLRLNEAVLRHLVVRTDDLPQRPPGPPGEKGAPDAQPSDSDRPAVQ